MGLFTRPSKVADKPGARQLQEYDLGPGQLPAVRDARKGIGIPADVSRQVRRTLARIRQFEPRWRELWAHFDGDQYVEVSAVNGELVALETRQGGTKPSWRSRLSRNRYTKGITGEVSVLTSRFPAYECTPLNSDPEKINAARTAEKVLQHLHSKLKLRRVTFRVGLEAAVTGDGYVWPTWDGRAGNPVDPAKLPVPEQLPDGSQMPTPTLRTGDIDLRVLRQDQVGWEPGVEFERSRYYVVRLTEAKQDVMSMDGYIGPAELASDAQAPVVAGRDAPADHELCFVYHYLERPCAKYPKGRWLTYANDALILPPADYDRRGDKPCLHRMPWIERGQRRDRSLGIGEQAIDVQRSINRIVNQLIAWRNLVLNPQGVAPEGSLIDGQDPSDEPGVWYEYRGSIEPKWREVPEIPVSLFKELDQAYADLEYIIGGGSTGPVIDSAASGDAYAAINEREQSFRSMLLGNLADFYSSLGDHLLEIVARRYTEDRLIDVQGRFGTETIPDFRGEFIAGSVVGVTVNEGSIVPRTRAAQEAKIMAFADKGWIQPHQAMAALNGGTADAIIDDFELDIARVHRQIQGLIMLGNDPHLQQIADPAALIPLPQPYDNHDVFISVIGSWLKTVDYERQPRAIQEAGLNWYQGHQQLLQQELDQEAMRVQARGAAQGMENAGKPQEPGGAPSQPSVANNAEALAGAA